MSDADYRCHLGPVCVEWGVRPHRHVDGRKEYPGDEVIEDPSPGFGLDWTPAKSRARAFSATTPTEPTARDRRTMLLERASGMLSRIEKNAPGSVWAAALVLGALAYDAGLHASRDPESEDAVNPFVDVGDMNLEGISHP
jgi:hypothetical protein